MKRVMILSFAAALLATGCTSKSTVKTPGIDLSNLDTTVASGDDFYDYARWKHVLYCLTTQHVLREGPLS